MCFWKSQVQKLCKNHTFRVLCDVDIVADADADADADTTPAFVSMELNINIPSGRTISSQAKTKTEKNCSRLWSTKLDVVGVVVDVVAVADDVRSPLCEQAQVVVVDSHVVVE